MIVREHRRTAGPALERSIVRSWRKLTGGHATRDAERRTLLACSGGADSTALVLALGCRHVGHVAVAHVVHDLRPREDTAADRDTVAELCERLGLTFVSTAVRVASLPGNTEDHARRARYDALAMLAREQGCRYVATAHHAEDQLESVLMALLRGSGPRGLAGMAARRPLSGGVELVRPMLECSRRDARDLCESVGVRWREDATNRDTSRLRARLRQTVVPELTAERSGLGRRLAHHRELLTLAADRLDDEARRITDHAEVGTATRRLETRYVEACERPIVHAALRRLSAELSQGAGLDRLSRRSLEPVADAVLASDGRERTIAVGRWRYTVARGRLTITDLQQEPTE
ncbi:MAG: tRNA lysidine(34) synthetase TilS [Planctomycetota bacterium]